MTNPFETLAANLVGGLKAADVAGATVASRRATRKIDDAQATVLAYGGAATIETWMGLLAAAANEKLEGSDPMWALELIPLLEAARDRLGELASGPPMPVSNGSTVAA